MNRFEIKLLFNLPLPPILVWFTLVSLRWFSYAFLKGEKEILKIEPVGPWSKLKIILFTLKGEGKEMDSYKRCTMTAYSVFLIYQVLSNNEAWIKSSWQRNTDILLLEGKRERLFCYKPERDHNSYRRPRVETTESKSGTINIYGLSSQMFLAVFAYNATPQQKECHKSRIFS